MKNQVITLKQGCIAFVVVILINLILVVPVFSQTIRPEKTVKAVYSDKSEKLRDVPVVSPTTRDRSWKDGVVKNKHGFHEEFKTPSFWTGSDPVLQDEMPSERSNPIIYNNFPGVSNVSGVAPPDPDGDVGPNHYFQMVNLAFAIWDKSGNILYGPADNSTLWDGFSGPWSGSNDGDPIIMYDEYADRWVASQFALPNYPNGPFYELVAVSETGDPTGAWYRYAFQFDNMPDYPKFGIWSDGYYFTINQFAPPYVSWAGAGVCVLDRAAMLTGNPNAEMIFFNLGTSYGSLLPADCDGPTLPPAGTSSYFAEIRTSSLLIWEADIDWNNTSNSSVTIASNLPVQSYSYSGITINQPNTTTTLMDITDRLMYRLQYRNFGSYQVMLTNHTVNANGSGQAGIRWYELRNYGSGWSVYQQGTYAPDDGENRWMASIAMNGDGDIALGYSVSSATTFPSIRFAGQNAESSGTGILDIPESSIKEGSASQTGINRWGDYSSMTVDPTDDQKFWYTAEYSNGGWNWKTQIASFSYAPIVDPPVADFSADDTHPMQGQTVQFMDQSTNVPCTWNWSFSPSTVSFVEGTTSGSKNPKVQFNGAGFYTVTLTATNDIGTDSEVKTNYINTLDCSPITIYPYLLTFDEWSESTPALSCTSDGTVQLDDCWTNATGDYLDWDILSGNTGSPSTGPNDDHGGGGNYAYTESSNCFNHDAFLESPAFNLSGISNPELRFWYHMYGSTMGTLAVQVSTNGGSTWSSNIWSLSGTQGDLWQEAVIPLGSYSTVTNFKLRFVGLTGTSWYSDMAIDDISVDGSTGSSVTANAGPDQQTCEDIPGQMNGTSYNSAYIVWTTSGDGSFEDVNDLNSEYTPGSNDINNGSAIITLTAHPIPPATGTATDQMVLTVQQEPTANAGGNGSTCAGVSYTVSGASAQNNASILWTENGTGSLSGATTLTPTYTPGNGETGNVTLTMTVQGQGGCGSAVSTMTLNIQSGATADAGADADICEGNTYSVTDATAANYTSLLWTENGTGTLTGANTLTPTYTPGNNETGTVTLTLTATGPGSCGNAVSTKELEIYGEPTANAGGNGSTCAGVSYTVSGASAQNNASILWTENGTGSLSGATTLIPTYTPGSGETGNVTLTMTVQGQGGCGSAVSTMTLNIQSGAIADAGADDDICEGNTYSVTDATAANYTSLLWTENGTGSLTGANTLTPTYTPGNNETGTVTLTLTATGPGSCGNAVSTKELEIYGEPTANAGGNGSTCAGVSYTVSGASAQNNASILWTENGTGSLSGATTLTPTYTPGNEETGNVTLTMTVQGQGGCGSAVSTMALNIQSGATADAGVDADICEGNTYSVTDATAANYTSLLWTENGTGSLTGANTLTPTYTPGNNETGTVTLTLTATGPGSCGNAVSTKELEIYGEPTANAGGNGSTCAGVSYTVSGASAQNNASILWTENGTGSLSGSTTLTPTYTPGNGETGNVTLTMTVHGQGGCVSAVSTMTLNVIGGATADAGSDATTCEGSAYTVTNANATNYSSVIWTTNGIGTLTNETTLTPTYTPASGETGNVTLILTVESGGGGMCGSAASSMLLSIMPNPMAFSGGDDVSCQGDPYMVSGAMASSGSSYLWTSTGTGSLYDETTLTPTYVPSAGETGDIILTLTVTSGGGGFCGTAASDMNLEILPGATADAGPDDVTCESVEYTITDATASDNSTILWTTNGLGTISNATSLTPTYYPANGETGSVNLTMTVTSGGGGMCGDDVSMMELEVIALPFADAGSNAEICQEETYTITDASASANSTKLWTSNGTGTITGATTLTPTYDPGVNEVGEVTLTLTVFSGNNGMCGNAVSSMIIDVLPSASANAGPDAQTCEQTPYLVTGATASDNSTISWTTNGSGNLTGANTLTPTYTPASGETGNITLTLNVVSGGGLCGSATSNMMIEIIPSAYADAGLNDESCQGVSYTINGASVSNNSTLLWSTNGNGTLYDETTLSPSYVPYSNETGDIIFTLTVTSGNNGACGTDVSSMVLSILPGAVADAGPDAETCENDSYTVTGASASDNSTLEWATTGNGVLTDIYTLTPTYTPATGEIGDVYLTLTVTSGGGTCGSTSSTMALFVNPAPYADAGNDDITCQGDPYTVTEAAASENSTYLWTTNGVGTLINETTLIPTYTPGSDENGEIDLTLTVSSGNGLCGEATSSMTLEIIPGASANAGADGSTCLSESYTVSGASASSNSTLLWTTNGDGVLSGVSTLTPTYTPATGEVGEITLTLTVTSSGGGVCGVAFSEMILTIYPEPVASAGNDIPICENSYAELNASALNYSLIEWTTSGDGYFNDENSLSAIYYPGNNDLNTGVVTLTMNVYSLACNMVSDELNVLISPMPYADAGEDDAICDDETYRMSGYAENEASVLWTTTGDGTFSNRSVLDPIYTPGPNDIATGKVTLLLTSFGMGACDTEVTDNMILTIETCTSVQVNQEPEVVFSIMPNPANDYIRFTVDHLADNHVEISLINMTGGVVRMEEYDVTNGSVNGRFILTGLEQGVYYIRVVSEDYYKAARLIKLK